jgi:small-conductance mechanosensitive channel
MTFVTRCLATFLVVMVLCSVAPAQIAGPQAAAPEVTLNSLRALSERMPKSADSDDELRSIDNLTNEIVAQAERFVAARTAQLADFNARLGELGPAPSAASNAENPDVTRQRAALESERNALDADIRLARLISVNAQQRRAEVLAQRRTVFEAQLFERSVLPLRSAFWNKARAQWKTDQAALRNIASEFEVGVTTALRDGVPAKLLIGALSVLAIVAVGVRLAEAGLARLVARTVPVGRLRRSLLALLTVLAYILIAGWCSLSSGTGWRMPAGGARKARVWRSRP